MACLPPLTRESSVDAGRKPSLGRKAHTRTEAGALPGTGSRCGGWGLHPVRRIPPSPARAGGAASTVDRGSGGSWLCS